MPISVIVAGTRTAYRQKALFHNGLGLSDAAAIGSRGLPYGPVRGFATYRGGNNQGRHAECVEQA
ncbi:MAG: hypothetical protein ACRYGG_01625 [Janthinobacterium lividum]